MLVKSTRWRWLIVVSCLLSCLWPSSSNAAELTAERVLDAISRSRQFLVSKQTADGSWSVPALGQYKVGVTGLVVLSLINGGLTAKDPKVQRGLSYLRSVKQPTSTYDISMMIMALAAANEKGADEARLHTLTQVLENGQIRRGTDSGVWGYTVGQNALDRGDHSNGQLAILALRDATEAGIPVDRATWQRARKHWISAQNRSDGGWGYTMSDVRSTGSMTVAGIATLVITSEMLRDDQDVRPDGTLNCCPQHEPDQALDRGIAWLERRFSIRHNPGAGNWLLYYTYGLERAGRLSARRLFGAHDWYREGATHLVNAQSARGFWRGAGHGESDPVIGTAFALLFLSKGLSPVLINKMKFGPRAPGGTGRVLDDDWNNHPRDVRNLTRLISGMPRWPKLVSTQTIDIAQLPQQDPVSILRDCPILYISGQENPRSRLNAQRVTLMRDYLDQGGFLLAVRNCNGAAFHEGMHELVGDLYPDGEARLKKLSADHPVFRSEFPLDPRSVELWGVDAGCRTTVIYCPEDLSCLWDRWARIDPPGRPAALKLRVQRATRIGVNVVAYVTGRRPPLRISDETPFTEDANLDRVERGFVKIAKLKHSGGWDTAPRALRYLLTALNRTAGVSTSTIQRSVLPADPSIFRYPLVYMHGRHTFGLNLQERQRLRQYLDRGGVLFADSCCGSKRFDESFRQLIKQMFPDQPLQRIPVQHRLFRDQQGFGHQIKTVKRRTAAANGKRPKLESNMVEAEPFLEGIEINGRLAVIYSRYDISCALERQASASCSGYVFDDALRLAVNVVLYAMLQDVDLRQHVID